jgi:hypothetical protein
MTDVMAIALGILLIVAALGDVFQSVVMPRAVGRRLRISAYLWRAAWAAWPRCAWRLYPRHASKREDFLAVFAPLMLVVLLAAWTVLLIFGYGLVFFGLRSGLSPAAHSLGDATYFAGTALTTLGFGDIVGQSAAARCFSILAGATGLALFSIITAYLFALFGSFQNREAFVVMIAARAGFPPSGVNLLAIAGYSKTTGDLNALMLDAQRWAAQVMETILAYPTLAYFRSSHDEQSWVGTLGTLLDAAALMTTALAGVAGGQAHIFYDVGRHAVCDLSRYFGIDAPAEAAGIERSEFDHACDRLAAAGYALRERDEAWRRFSALRSRYAAPLNGLARFFEIPSLAWIGDRTMLGHSPHG